ncbi:unnamed protein product [Mytilus edulis]|uniref:Farnesoic acid O-methyl transferase domain-containing protein n=1 Tax=Mytilus edulis TaxID=6550 RepID=A0A8S3TB20_MYTED|nr:unnamed protein product [Mytilus edulis]
MLTRKCFTASTISLTVEFNGTNHVLLQDYGVFPKHQKFLKFTVQGPKDLHLKLLSSKSSVRKPIYYIVIAGWNNKKSVLGRSEILAHDVVNFYKKPGLFDINHEKKFWISWENGKVLVGTGNILNKDIIMRWKEPCPFAVQNIEISTMHEASLNLKLLLDGEYTNCIMCSFDN